MEKSVSIIILNFNNKKIILDCLESLKKNTKYDPYNVIVADNGSNDDSVDIIRKRFKIDVIENRKNLGFAGGNNEAIKYSLKKYNPDYIFLLNNDTIIIQKDWLKKMIKVAESDDKIGIVGCKLIYPNRSLQHFAINGKIYMLDQDEKIKLEHSEEKEADKIQEVRWIIGAAFLIKRTVIEKIGFLDSKFFPIYGEEIDYCERAKKNGFRIIYTPFSTIIHVRSQTTNPKKKTRDWFISKKNSIRLELMNFSIKEILYWWIVHFGAVFFKKEKNKIEFRKDFFKRFILLLTAYFINLRNIKEILYKRKHRDMKIF